MKLLLGEWGFNGVHEIDSDGNQVWTYDGHLRSIDSIAVDPGLDGAFPDSWE